MHKRGLNKLKWMPTKIQLKNLIRLNVRGQSLICWKETVQKTIKIVHSNLIKKTVLLQFLHHNNKYKMLCWIQTSLKGHLKIIPINSHKLRRQVLFLTLIRLISRIKIKNFQAQWLSRQKTPRNQSFSKQERKWEKIESNMSRTKVK